MQDRPALNGNVVVISGASVGIGRALALELAAHGVDLMLAARDVLALDDVAGECRRRASDTRAVVQATDVTDETQCRRLIERTIQEYGHIDTLINNAGITMWARFDELSDLSIFERIMRVNYLGAVYLTYYALPHIRQTRGRLVAISSVAGKNGVPTRTGYSASKHAMVGFFDSLRIELRRTGVSVTVVFPDFVRTEIHKRALGPDGKPLAESPMAGAKIMSAEECARIAARGIARRDREIFMSARSKVGRWLKLITPEMVDSIAERAIARRR